MKLRILTGLALIAIALYVITVGDLPLFIWVLGLGLLIAYELIVALRDKDYLTYPFLIYFSIIGLMLLGYFPETRWIWSTPMMMGVSFLSIGWSLKELFTQKINFSKNKLLLSLKLILFITLPFMYIFLIRENVNGLMLLAFSITVISGGDILALFGGKLFGKTKLSSISPNKTIEGSLTALVGAVIFAYFFSTWLNYSPLFFVGLSLLISVFSQLGDLHESLTKRQLKIKDSSSFLPGHGGFYDRGDSIFFIIPILYFIFSTL